MTRSVRPLVDGLVLVPGLLVCMIASAAAQGGILGQVRDPDGVAVGGATVTAESLTSTITRTTTTNDAGRFAFIGLDRGEWLFILQADGFAPVQASANVRRSGSPSRVAFTMEPDLFNPPAPTAGVLAGLKSSEILERLVRAEERYAEGDYDGAIDAYRSVLESAPALTSVNLQIGHAFREKQDTAEALAAYRTALGADPTNVEVLAAIDAIGRP